MKKIIGFASYLLAASLFIFSFAQARTARTPESLISTLQRDISHRATYLPKDRSHYFYIPFAYQGQGNPAGQSHTFASMVEVKPNGQQVWTTISWLPQHFGRTQQICIFKNFQNAVQHELLGSPCKPTPGRNYSLVQSLRWGMAPGMTVAVWGPYRVSQSMYDQFLVRKSRLDRGERQYQADDRNWRTQSIAVNCMHAVSDLAHPYVMAPKYPYKIWGIKGTQHVLIHQVQAFSQWFYDMPYAASYRMFKN